MAGAPRVAVIDYKMCNLFSVVHACHTVGLDPVVTSDPAEVRASAGVILPGVGAFGDAMKNLKDLGLVDPVQEAVAYGKPFMGICLGFQLLFTESEEFGHHRGLGILKGKVQRFPHMHNDRKLKVPQIGWNTLRLRQPSPFLAGIRDGEYMYFVHSYYVLPDDGTLTLASTSYQGLDYCSAVGGRNLFACQFHPEKSSTEGIRIYRNWAAAVLG